MWVLLLCVAGQVPSLEAFPREHQQAALCASVRIVDISPRGGTGSGAIVGADERHLYILTAFHVVEPHESLEVQWFSTQSFPNPAQRFRDGIEIVVKSASADLALVRITTLFRPPAFLRIGAIPPAAQSKPTVLSVGCSEGAAPTCSLETINGLWWRQRGDQRVSFWLTNGHPPKGRSGGPLVDNRGQLIGVCRGYLAGNGVLPQEALYCSIREIHALLSTTASVAFLVQPSLPVAVADHPKLAVH